MIDVGLGWPGLSVEIDALYRPMNLTMAGVSPDGSLNSISPATVVTWQFPALVKYSFGSTAVRPFIEAGPSFRASGNLNDASPSTYGATGGIGVEAHLGGRMRIWSRDPVHALGRGRRRCRVADEEEPGRIAAGSVVLK